MFFARIIGHTVDRVVFKTERGYGIGYFVVTIVAEIVLGILASAIVMTFSRWREYRADAAGAKLSTTNDMIAALQRLRVEQGQPNELPGELTAFGIRPGQSGLANLFRSHPPLEDRIRVLQAGH
jgi:heat shock protein HtpX